MSSVTWHTEGRRHPDIIGKDVSGRKIPGGPYMIWQIAGLALIPLLWLTRGLWGARMPGLAQLVVIAAAAAAAVFLLGRINLVNRNPVAVLALIASAILAALAHPTGTIKGNNIEVPKPRRYPAPALHTRPAQPADDAISEPEPAEGEPPMLGELRPDDLLTGVPRNELGEPAELEPESGSAPTVVPFEIRPPEANTPIGPGMAGHHAPRQWTPSSDEALGVPQQQTVMSPLEEFLAAAGPTGGQHG